jgi:hypothetical protein
MALPAGITVNGVKSENSSGVPVPPKTKKIIALLDKHPSGDVLTTMELASQLGLSMSGNGFHHPALADYKEKVDGKVYWGNPQTIAELRKPEPEETRES